MCPSQEFSAFNLAVTQHVVSETGGVPCLKRFCSPFCLLSHSCARASVPPLFLLLRNVHLKENDRITFLRENVYISMVNPCKPWDFTVSTRLLVALHSTGITALSFVWLSTAPCTQQGLNACRVGPQVSSRLILGPLGGRNLGSKQCCAGASS